MKWLKKFTILTLMLCMFFVPVASVKAAPCQPGGGGLPIPTWYQYLPGETVDGTCRIANDGLDGSVFNKVLLGVLDILAFIAGIAAVLYLIWSGVKLLISTGESQKIAGARSALLNALIGLVIAIIASQLIDWIASTIA